MLWSLLALVPVLAVAYVVWTYRRKFAAKEAASRERLALLLGDQRAGPAATAGTAPARGAPGVPAAAPAAAAPVPAWTARERFLSQDLKAECLNAAGIRLLRMDPAALPRREEVRTLVCGGNQ